MVIMIITPNGCRRSHPNFSDEMEELTLATSSVKCEDDGVIILNGGKYMIHKRENIEKCLAYIYLSTLYDGHIC